MTEGILSRKDCAACKICCEFHNNSKWDAPGFTFQETQRNPEQKFRKDNQTDLYYLDPIAVGEDLYQCPLLTDTGCALGEDKPFKCAIWPLYVVRYEGEISLAITNVCQLAFAKSDEELISGLKRTGAIERIRVVIAKNPELIENNKPHFRLLMNL